MTETYKLTAGDVPGRRTHSLHVDILEEFRAIGGVSVLLQATDTKPQTLRAGLRTAIKQEGTEEVHLVQREEDIYPVICDSGSSIQHRCHAVPYISKSL